MSLILNWGIPSRQELTVNSSAIIATGDISIELICTTTTGITGTADDFITKCTDPTISHAVDGVQTAKNTLPEFSLVSAYPTSGGCTFDSIINPTWKMRGIFFEATKAPADDPNNVTLIRLTTGLSGPGFDWFWFYIFAEPVVDPVISGSGIDTL